MGSNGDKSGSEVIRKFDIDLSDETKDYNKSAHQQE